MRRALLSALALLVLTACGEAGPDSKTPDRAFLVGELALRDDGQILLAGLAQRGKWDSEQDDYCEGDGPATSDFMVVRLSSDGEVLDEHSRTEEELDACAVQVARAEVEDDALVVSGLIRESPGLFGGEGGPESRERGLTLRFDPEPEEIESDPDREPTATYAHVQLPDGDLVVIEEDTRRQRLGPEGYSGTLSLARRSDEPAREWAFPVPISPNVDIENLGGGTEASDWRVFLDGRRGFYGFAYYPVLSSRLEEVALFRHRLDGRPDPTFGEQGRVLVTPGADWLYRTKRAARTPDGDLVVAGTDQGGKLVLRRYTAAGEPVTAFGRAPVECGSLEAFEAQRDGKLVVACARGSKKGSVVVRLLPDGSLDPTFGDRGRAVIRTV